MNLTINLENPQRGFVTVPVKWPFHIPKPESDCFISRLFRRAAPKCARSFVVGIGNIRCASSMAYNKEALFRIVYQGKDFNPCSRGVRVEMTSDDMPFKLQFNTAAITDYQGNEKRVSLTADLVVYDGKRIYGENINLKNFGSIAPLGVIKVFVTITFAEVKPNPSVLLDLEESAQFSRRNPLVHVGELRVMNACKLSFCPQIDINPVIRFYDSAHTEIKGAVVLGDPKETDGMLLVQDVMIDMLQLRNPKADRELCEIECGGSYTIKGGDGTVMHLPKKFQQITLLRDTLGAKAAVFLDGAELKNNYQGAGHHLLKQVNFTIGTSLTRPYKLDLCNQSSDDSIAHAGVLVKNLRITAKVCGAKIFDAGGHELDNELFKVSGSKKAVLCSEDGLLLPNGLSEESKASLTLTFDPTKIDRIDWDTDDLYLFTIFVNVDYEYFENKDGKALKGDEPMEKFHTTLKLSAFLEPNPEWLCVDYGTSAIVAMYQNRIIDLHSRKRSIVHADKEYSKYAFDTLEPVDSPFLSSDILLHNIPKRVVDEESPKPVSSLSSQQRHTGAYSDLAVCLSPTSSMITSSFSNQIPCLKMLVGREMLPDNSNYNIKYYYKRGKETIHVDEEKADKSSSLMDVLNVFRESYHSLFRYFIQPEIGNLDKLNRLVLTYPNTYTPRHLSMIRSIVKQVFPSIRMDNSGLKFVSESDAVAAFYMRHWSTYHKAGEKNNKNENILVFDMGAGTLDVSLIQKQCSDNKYNLRIIGKLGSCKAGNYLDFVLAEIICELNAKINPLVASTGTAALVMNERVSMKLAIKSEIKPQLSVPVTNDGSYNDNIVFTFNNRKEHVSRSKILNHALFRDYLNAITTEMLGMMCSYVGSEDLKIDTVLMSGRSCRLLPLQQKLAEAVSQRCSTIPEFIALDVPINPQGVSKDCQKTAVAQGAMIIADVYSQPMSNVAILSKRLYANYGIAYQREESQWQYLELLNHKDIPMNSSHEEYLFKVRTVEELALAPEIKLIQTYMNEADTAKCLNNRSNDYITIMGRFARGDYSSEMSKDGKLEVGIVLTENDEVVLRLGNLQSMGSNPKSTDFESEIIKRSFWPIKITS